MNKKEFSLGGIRALLLVRLLLLLESGSGHEGPDDDGARLHVLQQLSSAYPSDGVSIQEAVAVAVE
jgi:hypothetical protein